jgi:hypothetical protein
MFQITLDELAAFPDRLERHFRAIPQTHWTWTPPSWEEVPSERFTALEQICHVRDIEIDGYRERLRRMLETESPHLESLDGYELARQRRYAEDDAEAVLRAIRWSREQTLQTVRALSGAQLARTGEFEGYGPLTVQGLMHYLCSHDQQHLAGLQWLLGKIDGALHPRTLNRS